MTDAQMLAIIQEQIPEFDADKLEDGWVWTYRCAESEDSFDSLFECFVDFAAKTNDLVDAHLGLNLDLILDEN